MRIWIFLGLILMCPLTSAMEQNMDQRKITGIMACDPNGVIGNKGTLPWDCPEELDHFRKTTLHQIMIMGYKTYLSTPLSLLKNRYSIVFTHHHDLPSPPDNVRFVHSVDEFLQLSPLPNDKELFMIGGGELASVFFEANLLDEFLLTKIHQAYEGDTFFPLRYLDTWSSTILRAENDFTIYKYIKRGDVT